jgi:hypothetical protein
MEALTVMLNVDPNDFVDAMVEQYSPSEMADIVMRLPRKIQDKQFVQTVHQLYSDVLKIYAETEQK